MRRKIVMARQRGIYQSAGSASAAARSLTARQVEVLQLAGRGLSDKQIARHLGISVRTVEDHLAAMRLRTGAKTRSELIAYWAAAGLVKPGRAVPETVVSGTTVMPTGPEGENRPGNLCRPNTQLGVDLPLLAAGLTLFTDTSSPGFSGRSSTRPIPGSAAWTLTWFAQ
jgi:LuxR family maltose regulon positive regulatory protein/two-component system response regulator NreC